MRKDRINFNDDASFNTQKLIDHNEPVEPAPIKLEIAPTFWQKVWRWLTK